MSRLQLALNVENLEESIAHYSKIFGVGPAKVRPGYANFAVVNPPLKLVLIENPGASDSINHLGVEVESVDAVRSEHERVTAAGLPVWVEGETTCCTRCKTSSGLKVAHTSSRFTRFLPTPTK